MLLWISNIYIFNDSNNVYLLDKGSKNYERILKPKQKLDASKTQWSTKIVCTLLF